MRSVDDACAPVGACERSEFGYRCREVNCAFAMDIYICTHIDTNRPTDPPRAARRSKLWVGPTDRPTHPGRLRGQRTDSGRPTDRPSLWEETQKNAFVARGSASNAPRFKLGVSPCLQIAEMPKRIRRSCEHGRVQYTCKDCGGKGICNHGIVRRSCKLCRRTPRAICEHGRQPYVCKECGGKGICEHNRRKAICKECNGADICRHGLQRQTCKDCNGADICVHGRRYHRCKMCNARCDHGLRRGKCTVCIAESFCNESSCEDYFLQERSLLSTLTRSQHPSTHVMCVYRVVNIGQHTRVDAYDRSPPWHAQVANRVAATPGGGGNKQRTANSNRK